MGFFQRRIILIADDNRDLAISLSILLKLVGFEVDIVHNGRDAVTAAKIRRPDVLLLDIGLPGCFASSLRVKPLARPGRRPARMSRWPSLVG